MTSDRPAAYAEATSSARRGRGKIIDKAVAEAGPCFEIPEEPR